VNAGTDEAVHKTYGRSVCDWRGFGDEVGMYTNGTSYDHETEETMNIALLSRVSTGKQDNENQLIQLREFAEKQGWKIVAEYLDVVTGSGKRTRAQFDAMMRDASQKRFSLVLFWKLDRFSREGTRATLRHLQQLDNWGVAWRSFQEPYFDSCGLFKDVVISIMATLAEQERITISERTKAGLARTRKAGTRLGRRPAQVDMALVEKRHASGESLRGIARSLRVSPALLIKRRKASARAN
jgi:DNA invertase Pin-like site-specific DNA recombinase